MSDFNWDDYKQNGNWISFNDVGDNVVGVIKAAREGRDFNGNPCPELVLEVEGGEEKTLTAGQVLLRAALTEMAPKVGDRIRIVYSGVGPSKPGKAPAKEFTVDVKPGPHEITQPAVSNSSDPF